MIDGIFVFDGSIHAYDLSDENLREDRTDARQARDLLLGLGAATRHPAFNEGDVSWDRRWTPEDLYEMVFVESPTDMAMAQVVPIFDWYENTFAPIEAQHGMAERYPDRVLFCGGVDPLYPDLKGALASLDHQVEELGARSIKFYNGHVDRYWRCDDKELAYPIYERCQQLGIEVLQFHKGLPFGLMDLESMSPLDLQAPARDFPEMQFVIHHLAIPYFDEAIWIANRFPNVHLLLAGNINNVILQPRVVQEQLGRLLMEVGIDKLMWGSDAALSGPPRPYLEAFMEVQIPDDLRDGYGYPQLTRSDKEKILGLNFARLFGIDVDAKRRELDGE